MYSSTASPTIGSSLVRHGLARFSSLVLHLFLNTGPDVLYLLLENIRRGVVIFHRVNQCVCSSR
jgi:hypothetical protein